MVKKWIEAMRLRTLPVSISGVLAGCGCAIWQGKFSFVPALLCLLFAMTAQIASNFGNEYYDFKNGIDRKGREGFRRGVTEGDITPLAMKRATFTMLGIAASIGFILLLYGTIWLILAGCAILLFALAYSTGPYPLSHHGLGDITVVIFFGIVPVTLTCYLQTGEWNGLPELLSTSVATGLLAANVLIVNNYRDLEDDKAVGKKTTVVLFGRIIMGKVYLFSGILAMAIMYPLWIQLPAWALAVPAIYLVLHYTTWRKIMSSEGAALNPLLGRSAINLLLFTMLLLAVFLISSR
ncbi:MAG: 1,4-dihydroxy-2-naphthoate octaprenyltransferase [Bacteroidaceae bacterium]|nr:1,4-dihydroxy-2-naphthoate octaprenyltransferase [Bacteroidaceae bacterium]